MALINSAVPGESSPGAFSPGFLNTLSSTGVANAGTGVVTSVVNAPVPKAGVKPGLVSVVCIEVS